MMGNSNYKTTKSLEKAKTGEVLEVTALAGGRAVRERLLAMGIGPGTMIEVASIHPFRGPVTVRVGGSHIAVGRGVARFIQVAERNG